MTVKNQILSSNQLTSHASSDGKLIPIQAEITQSQVSNKKNNNNNNMLFHLPPASIQVQSNIDEKQKSNNHCVKSVRIRSYSGSHFPAFGLNTLDIATRSYRDLHKKSIMTKYNITTTM